MKDYIVKVESNSEIADKIYEMTLGCKTGEFESINAGQFLHLQIPGFLLRRPFGIYKFSKKSVSIAYAAVGKGTEEMTRLNVGAELKVTLPLGNGFILKPEQKKVVLLGGGMGCVPLAAVPVTYPDRKFCAYLGFSDKKRMAFVDEFSLRAKTTVCTDDGSVGFHGYPMDALKGELASIMPDVILACGPKRMLMGAKAFAVEHSIPILGSLEERMGCGVGACLVCACKLKDKDGKISSRRVCADGPVFDLTEVEF